jgi:hypothetical protein
MLFIFRCTSVVQGLLQVYQSFQRIVTLLDVPIAATDSEYKTKSSSRMMQDNRWAAQATTVN